GRMGVSNQAQDAYAFKVPSLRNLAFTAPYGHNGAYATLEGIINHHNNPIQALENYDRSQAILPAASKTLEFIDWVGFNDKREMQRIKQSIDIEPLHLTQEEIEQIIAFLDLLNEPDLIARIREEQ
ncbi:MAG: hypothetical protein ACPHYA_05590, partial [Pseudomonadales bacterium]